MEWNNSVYFRLSKILCGFKDQVRTRSSGEKCRLATHFLFRVRWQRHGARFGSGSLALVSHKPPDRNKEYRDEE